MEDLKGKVSGSMDGGGQYGSTSTNGIEGQRGGAGQAGSDRDVAHVFP